MSVNENLYWAWGKTNIESLLTPLKYLSIKMDKVGKSQSHPSTWSG